MRLFPLSFLALATCWILSFSDVAWAINEALTFRVVGNGHVVAVVSGLDDGPGCLLQEFHRPESIIVTGNSIAITSNANVGFCTIPLFPLVPYEVVADLGVLAPGVYQITWTQGPVVLSAQFAATALAPEPIPTMSFAALLTLALSISFITTRSLTTRSTGRAGAEHLSPARLWRRAG